MSRNSLVGIAGLLGSLIGSGLVLIIWILTSTSSPGAGPSAAGSPSETPDRRPTVQDGQASPIESQGAGAFSSRTAAPLDAAPAGHDGAMSDLRGGAAVYLATLLDRYEFATPSPEDIAWLTIDSWTQQEFLELTEQEAHDLLPLDDTIGLKGPTSLLSVIGPMPTTEDCARGFASEEVRVALQQVLVLEAVITELGMVPRARRDVLAEARIEEAVRLRDAAALELMRRLEEASGYPNWRTWWSLYRRWSE